MDQYLFFGPSREFAGRGRRTDLLGQFESEESKHRRVTMVKRICAGCPVRAECEEAGKDERHGIWGGLTEQERALGIPFADPKQEARVRRQLAKQTCKREHPLDGINLYITPDGKRRCRRCRRDRAKQARQLRDRIPLHVHGSINGYTNYRCRCPRCRDAQKKARAL